MLFNENVELNYDAEVDENILEDVTWEDPNQERENIRNHMSTTV